MTTMIISFIYTICFVSAITSLGASAYFFLSWQQDNQQLRSFAAPILDNRVIDGKAIEELIDHIYHTQGFAKNNNYFVLNKLGPTPIQIIQHGGDCSNKSRLASAILDEYKINSSLVMLSACKECSFEHTVIEARTSHGPAVYDPVYNISFPNKDGGFYGIKELRNNPAILEDRLAQLTQQRGAEDKVAFYHDEEDGMRYDFPKSINLEKNSLLRAVKQLLSIFSKTPELIYRPRFLEDPKYFLTLATGSIGLVLLLLGFILKR